MGIQTNANDIPTQERNERYKFEENSSNDEDESAVDLSDIQIHPSKLFNIEPTFSQDQKQPNPFEHSEVDIIPVGDQDGSFIPEVSSNIDYSTNLKH